MYDYWIMGLKGVCLLPFPGFSYAELSRLAAKAQWCPGIAADLANYIF